MNIRSATYLNQNSQYESTVGDHLPNLPLVLREHWQDIWDEVSHTGEDRTRKKIRGGGGRGGGGDGQKKKAENGRK